MPSPRPEPSRAGVGPKSEVPRRPPARNGSARRDLVRRLPAVGQRVETERQPGLY